MYWEDSGRQCRLAVVFDPFGVGPAFQQRPHEDGVLVIRGQQE
jgi:hypothetical protein